MEIRVKTYGVRAALYVFNKAPDGDMPMKGFFALLAAALAAMPCFAGEFEIADDAINGKVSVVNSAPR